MRNMKLNKKIFVRFLKENNCYYAFIRELENANKMFDESYSIDYIIEICIEKNLNIFNCAFIPSKKTVNFWDNMAAKWKLIYE